jgi:hypothetical protein
VRHATYYRQWLSQNGTEWSTLATGAERSPHFAGLNNVRAALEWCFGVNGNAEIGVGLAAAAAPVFWAMSLLPECHRWSQQAILALDDTNRGRPVEVHLQAGLGTSLMNIHGKGEAAQVALNRSLAIAEGLDDHLGQMGLLGVIHVRGEDFKAACIAQSAVPPLPSAPSIRPPERFPAACWEGHSSSWAMLTAPAQNLRHPYSIGLIRSAPAPSILPRIGTIGPASPWQGPSGYRAIPVRP